MRRCEHAFPRGHAGHLATFVATAILAGCTMPPPPSPPAPIPVAIVAPRMPDVVRIFVDLPVKTKAACSGKGSLSVGMVRMSDGGKNIPDGRIPPLLINGVPTAGKPLSLPGPNDTSPVSAATALAEFTAARSMIAASSAIYTGKKAYPYPCEHTIVVTLPAGTFANLVKPPRSCPPGVTGNCIVLPFDPAAASAPAGLQQYSAADSVVAASEQQYQPAP